MTDIEICTNCHQSFNIYFNDITSDYVLYSEVYFFCHDCLNQCFDCNFDYEDGFPNGSLELPSKTSEFINKEGEKVIITQRGYVLENIRKLDREDRLLYEKQFLGFDTPKKHTKDIRKYVIRKYYEDGTLKHESFCLNHSHRYGIGYTEYTSPIKKWYPNGVLQSEKVMNVSEKIWDTDGYLLVDNHRGEKNIQKTWYKNIDMCLVMSDFMNYYGDMEEEIYVEDRDGNRYQGAFDTLGNLVPYRYDVTIKTNEYRISNIYFESLYKYWSEKEFLTKEIFDKKPRIQELGSDIKIILNGIYKIYNLQGILVEEVSYNKNKLNGVYKRWNWETGSPIKEYNFQNDRLNGICREWSFNGNLLKEHTYEKNKLNGLCIENSEEGILLREHNYKDNKLEGMCRDYDETGKLIKSGIFINGKWDGSGNKVTIRKMSKIEF